ncbi:MAG: hypothetical protein KQI62_09055 [Deltaproteobacteria bacterium]|nr:hypothetical protein [Deltaproteobacteria bacterium]
MSDAKQTPQAFDPTSTRGRECLDLINSLRSLGVAEDEIQRAALSYWTGAEPNSFEKN